MATPQSRPPAAGPGHPGQDRRKITSRKVIDLDRGPDEADDSLAAWTQRYLDLAVRGVRSDEVTGRSAGTSGDSPAGSPPGSGTTRFPPSPRERSPPGGTT